MEENVDLHDGENEEETGDDDDDYDSVHADDSDGNDNNDRDNEYDGRNKDHDVVLQEVGSFSKEEEDDNNDEQEVNDAIKDKFRSRVGWRVTTFQSWRFFGDSD